MSRGVVIPRVAALDGLRGAAVAGVLLFHGGYLTGGYLGVDLFFVLSGFLITTLLLVESDRTGNVRLGSFWARRARRLLPALFGLMVGVALYCVVFASRSELGQIRGDALATLGYVANWRSVFASQDYFALFSAPSPLQHTWSLAIEEQFYLVWPLVFVGLLAWWKQAAPRAVLVVALLGAIASTVLMVALFDPVDVSRAYYGTDTRAAGILLGAALAAALVIWGPVRGRAARIALEVTGVAAILGLAYAWTQVGGQSPGLYRGGFFLCGVAVVAVIAAAAHPTRGPISVGLSWRPLCLLGLISYGAYLWHWPVYVVLDQERTGTSGLALLALRVAITLVIAIASYRFIEQPIRHGVGTARMWRVVVPVAASGLVVLVFAATLGAQPRRSVAAPATDDLAAVSRRASAHPGAQRVMVVGNSVGFFLASSFESIDARPPVTVLNAALEGCVVPHDIHQVRYHLASGEVMPRDVPRCDTDWKRAVERFRPDVVFWIVSEPPDGDLRYGSRWIHPCTPVYDRLYRRDLRQAASVLGARGAQVVFVSAAPARLLGRGPDQAARTECDNRLRREVARSTGSRFVDLDAFVCPGGTCPRERDGVVLRPDGLHYEGPGGRVVATYLLDAVRRPQSGS